MTWLEWQHQFPDSRSLCVWKCSRWPILKDGLYRWASHVWWSIRSADDVISKWCQGEDLDLISDSFIVLICYNIFTELYMQRHLSHLMTKQTKWHVRPAKTQISLGIRPVKSEFSPSAWRKLGSLAAHWAHTEGSDQTGRMPRLIWVSLDAHPFCWFCHEAAHFRLHVQYGSTLRFNETLFGSFDKRSRFKNAYNRRPVHWQ